MEGAIIFIAAFKLFFRAFLDRGWDRRLIQHSGHSEFWVLSHCVSLKFRVLQGLEVNCVVLQELIILDIVFVEELLNLLVVSLRVSQDIKEI